MGKSNIAKMDLFDALHKSRMEDWKTFQKKDYSGIWSSIIDKYPETAHFVYELLQNADDAGATDVTIVVKSNELLFKHNGTKHFDITEEGAEHPGDINSITGIGDSSKDGLSNKIGKFGVGFKAVFQYTDTPEIYDDIYKFKIENYIIPCLVEKDHPQRKEGETLFVFPYKNPEKSFEDITERLERLDNPILFLRNLLRIKLIIQTASINEEYEYSKELQEHIDYGEGLSMDKYLLHEPSNDRCIFLFSQNILITEAGKEPTNHLINVGFFYDELHEKLITDTIQNIYCFFPTKETFKTCFISHAPFLLTDSRQNLKPSEKLNHNLVNLLADLAVTAVLKLRDYGKKRRRLLIDENITSIIPKYSTSYWHTLDVLFEKPIKEAFDKALANEAILLSRNGRYLTMAEAYKGSPKELTELLSLKQFNDLRQSNGNLDFLKWELSLSIDDSELYSDVETYTSESLADDITASFMKKQEFKWVTRFYTYLRQNASSLWKIYSNNSRQRLPFRSAPIIKTQNGEWVAPYIDSIKPNVFFPIDGQSGYYHFIDREYCNNELAKKFFSELEINTPDDYDYIRTVILPKYLVDDVSVDDEDLFSDMKFLIAFYGREKDSAKVGSILKEISEKIYLVSNGDYLFHPSELFLYDEILNKYYGKELKCIDIDYYEPVIKKYGQQKFNEFVCLLGVNKYPRVIHSHPYYKYQLDSGVSDKIETWNWSEYEITDDYCMESFRQAVNGNRITKEVSVYLWNVVLPAIGYSDYCDLNVTYRRKYARYSDRASYCSTFKYELQNLKWIYDDSGECYNAKQLGLENLAQEYERSNGLIQFLGIEKKEKSILELGGTEQQQKEHDLGKEINDITGGIISRDEVIQLLCDAVAKKKAEMKSCNGNLTSAENTNESQICTTEDGSKKLDEKLKNKWNKKANEQNRRPHGGDNKMSSESSAQQKQNATSSQQPFFDNTSDRMDNMDSENAQSKTSSNLKRKNTEAKERAEETSEQIEILERLEQTDQYSFMWYKLLMELMHADKSKSTNRIVQVDFSEWSFECSDKILRLSNPSKPIPSWLSDSETITISSLSDKPKKIDGIVVKTDELSADLSIVSPEVIRDICSAAKKIRIIAENTTNIIDSLERRFLQLGYEDDYNLNENLPQDIQFIYGPPGTGKTTKLVSMIHDIIINRKSKINILILTPTNKAADVIAEKLVDDDVCYDYLSRYGATESIYLIEDAAVVMNRDTMDMNMLDSNILVTTAARYSYDCVQPNDTFICDFNWDYIIVDEASMIDIITITYILHKGSGAKYIIAGDPKQIQPVPQNDMPPINVYDMVGLNEFATAIHNYSRYPVTALTTQYRSIPSIGDLVSLFAYNGIVQPYKNRVPQKPLVLDGIKINDINFLGFDLVELDLIKGCNSVGDSAFHLYSVIFSYNLAEYMAKQIYQKYKDSSYSIGIVCPYKSQADAIGQMLDNRPINNACCHVSCGTVHSFQGDECDIMLVVLNPPLNCSRASHINNTNILNVAMSRARDYLFLIMPNGQPKGFYQKNVIGKCVNILNRSILDCSKVEEIILGSADYITSNTHVTCHMPVNVYKDSNAKYEVRISDDALDIKINE